MEIKTTEEIINEFDPYILHGVLITPEDNIQSKWLGVESLTEWFKNHKHIDKERLLHMFLHELGENLK